LNPGSLRIESFWGGTQSRYSSVADQWHLFSWLHCCFGRQACHLCAPHRWALLCQTVQEGTVPHRWEVGKPFLLLLSHKFDDELIHFSFPSSLHGNFSLFWSGSKNPLSQFTKESKLSGQWILSNSKCSFFVRSVLMIECMT
jgi:hypothetical protein